MPTSERVERASLVQPHDRLHGSDSISSCSKLYCAHDLAAFAASEVALALDRAAREVDEYMLFRDACSTVRNWLRAQAAVERAGGEGE